MKICYSLCIVLLLVACGGPDESGMEVNLTGPWRIWFGDDTEYARPDLDDGDWDRIRVPASWEERGFPGYDGYAWYRKAFHLSDELERKALYLDLGLIYDADEVYINGHFLDGRGSFPPSLAKAMNTRRLYDLPKDWLHFGNSNVIAIRVYNEEGKGGIVAGEIGIYSGMVDSNRYRIIMSEDLSGEWRFRMGNEDDWAEPQFDDSHWSTLSVPGFWESQGYGDLDGYAWYRKKVVIPEDLMDTSLILALGRIDDLDTVYFNGEMIGNTGKFPDNHSNRTDYMYWSHDRFYYIPTRLILPEEKNTIAVRVYDFGQHGGIYEGPIGIVSQEAYLDYSKHVPSDK